jgi:hypothetical protein
MVVRWPSDRVTRENYMRIRAGMTQADVEAILGPPGDYTTGPFSNGDGEHLLFEMGPEHPLRDPTSQARWLGDRGWIQVDYATFSRPRIVVSVAYDDCEPLSPQTPFENLRWRAERQWRRWFYSR